MIANESFPGELEDLRIRLMEAEETLEAIRSGSVDAIVVSGKTGEQVYTLQGADQSYRLLVESINEGTVTMSMDGTILYSNKQFADMLGHPLEKIICSSFLNFFSDESRDQAEDVLNNPITDGTRFQALLNSSDSGKVPAQITLGKADASVDPTLTAVITDLSGQFRYQQIVREEKLSHSIMESSPDGIAVCDAKGMVIRASKALNQFCRESALMKPFNDVFHIEFPATDRPPEIFSAMDILAGKHIQNVEALLYCATTDVYNINLSAVPLQNDDHAIIGCLINITDITGRKQTEEALRQLAQLLDLSYDAIFTWDLDGAIEYWNEGAERLYGYSRDEAKGLVSHELLHTRRSVSMSEVRTILERNGEWTGELLQVTKDGRTIAVDSRHQLMRRDDRLIVLETNRDVTARKRAEERDRRNNKIMDGINKIFHQAITCETEEQLGHVCLGVIENLTESAMGFIGEIGPDNQLYEITISNPGWEACAMIDQTGYRRVPGRFKIQGLYGRVLEDGKSVLINNPAEHPDSIGIPEGHPPLKAFLGVPLVHDSRTIGLIAVGNREGGYTIEQQEILEALAPVVLQSLLKKRTETELQASERRFRAFFENAEVGTAELSPDGQFINVNSRLCQMTGYNALELQQMTPLDLSPPEDAEHDRKILDAYLHGSPSVFDVERRYRQKNGKIIWVQVTEAMIRDADGKPLRSAGVIIDINDRKQAEEALNQQSAKLETANRELETFAYSISHDLRAPLRAIDGYSRMLLAKTGDRLNDEERRRFDVIRENTKKMEQLIDDVLAFSRLGRQAMSLGRINMPDLVKELWEELLTINPGRRMSLKMGNLPKAFGDTALIRQVLANLLSNAVKFTRKKEDALIEIGGVVKESETVYFIRDNGAGFDMKYYDKLFGVFQRLHSDKEYEGTGAGLAIAHRIIKRHGGRVWGEGEVDKGACFHFSLPAESD